MSDLKNKVKKLNKAYKMLKDALEIIDMNTNNTPDMKTYFWRLEKAIADVAREIMKQLEKENTDDEFKNIMKGFK